VEGLRPLLSRLGVSEEDAAAVVAARPSPARDPEAWWLVERCAHMLVRDIGGWRELGWPALPGRLLYVYVFLAVLPHVRKWHDERRIPEEVAWATLADLGRVMAIQRRIHGEAGVGVGDWLTLHFRGAIYELGRLQFARGRIGDWAEALGAAGAHVRPGDYVLDLHIPESGPLTPGACDASLAAARSFFERHFPEEPYRVATCGSWLLDEQLAEYLEADSNIVRFQRRFRLLPGGSPADADVFRFVFRRPDVSLGDVPQRTRLERAIVAHLRAGRHWLSRTGWLEL
jgi:GNAT-like C-terminal domain/N-acyltransferase N-terminal domain